jgi:prenyltransferase beta subunit
VDWWSLVWFPFPIPKQTSDLVGNEDALSTGRKLLGWGFQRDVKCIFCRSGIEDRDHLFFSCGFSGRIWKKVMGLYGAWVESTHLLG